MTTIRPSQSWAASNYSIENQPAFAGRRKKKKAQPVASAPQSATSTGEAFSIGKLFKTVFFGWLLLSAGTGIGMASAKPLRTRGNCEPGPCPPEESGNTGPFNSTASAMQTLRCPPFPPTNTTLFTPQTYSDAPPLIPAIERPWNETTVISQLQDTLESRFTGNETAVDQAMALYNNSQIQSLVPDARLRAALVSLKGTAGEAAIDSIQSGKFREMSFADLPDDIIAMVQRPTTNQTKPTILFNDRYQHEDFRLLAPIVMHETLHEDSAVSGREERINTILETEVYGQFAAEDPSLAHSATELARRHNTRLMAWVNSRTDKGKLRPYTAQAGNVFPGGRPLNNFASAFTTRDGKPLNDSSPGNPTLRGVLQDTTGVDVEHPDFDAATDEVIDQHQEALNPKSVVRIAKDVLKLNTTCETDKPAGPSTPVTSSAAASSATRPSPGLLAGIMASATLLMNQFWGRWRQA